MLITIVSSDLVNKYKAQMALFSSFNTDNAIEPAKNPEINA